MVDQFTKAMAALLVVGVPMGAVAQQSPFIDVIVQSRQADDGGCQEGIVLHRIHQWYNLPPTVPAFATVEEITSDMREPVALLEARGCNPEFLWTFLACTRVDESNEIDTPGHIVPRHLVLWPVRAFQTAMLDCLDALDQAGIAARN